MNFLQKYFFQLRLFIIRQLPLQRINQQSSQQIKMQSRFANKLPEVGQFDINKDYLRYNEQAQKIINALNEKIRKFSDAVIKQKQLAKSLNDIKKVQQAQKIAFQNYLSFLQVMDYTHLLQKKPNSLYYMIVGHISAGKSSLINHFLDANQAVGVGETTSEAKCVKKLLNQNGQCIYIWDTSGSNEQFNILNAETLGYFKSADKIIIVGDKGITSLSEIMRVVTKVNPHSFYYVRTKCDEHDERHYITLDQLLQRDFEDIAKLGIEINKSRMFQISTKKPKQYRDNMKFEKELKN